MGMLMTTAYILAMDTFGPITDNAGGIAEFSRAEKRRPRDHRPARRRWQHDQGPDQGLRDRVGVAGRVPAVQRLHRQGQPDPVARSRPVCARQAPRNGQPGGRQRLRRRADRRDARLLLQLARDRAVGTTAQSIIVEVRRQFREMPGIMDYTQRPDYARVVDITTKAALREMICPASSRSRRRSPSGCCSASKPWPAC